MSDAGPLPHDVDPRIVKRERRAVRSAAATAISSWVIGLEAWVLGPCLATLVWPYVWRGRLILAVFALLLAAAGAALFALAFRAWRHLREDRAAVGRDMGQIALVATVAGLPGLMWWPFLIYYIATGGSFYWYWPWAVGGTLLVSLPLVPGLLGLLAWIRHRRVYPVLEEPAPVAPRRRQRLAQTTAVLTAVLWLLALVMPGGPGSSRTGGEVQGVSVDEWGRRWACGAPGATEALVAAGPAGVDAIRVQWPPGSGFREAAAWWLGEAFDLADNIWAAFEHIRIGVAGAEARLKTLAEQGPKAGALAPVVAEWSSDRQAASLAKYVECLEQIGPAAASSLIELAQDGNAPVAAMQAIAWMRVGADHGFGETHQAALRAFIAPEQPDRLRLLAAIAFGRVAEPGDVAEVTLPVLLDGLAHQDHRLRLAAVRGAAWIGPRAGGVAGALRRMAADAQRRSSPSEGSYTLIALACVAPEAVETRVLIRSGLGHTDPRIRDGAAVAAAVLGGRAAPLVPLLVPLLSDPDNGVRSSALQAVARIEGHVRSALPAIQAALAGPMNTQDYYRICQQLSYLGPLAKDAEPLLEAASNAGGPGNNWMVLPALTAVQTGIAAWPGGSLPPGSYREYVLQSRLPRFSP